MDLPPHTDDMIDRILDVRPDAVIVTQSGAPVRMPWASKAASMLHIWYGGNEVGNGIADVLFGDVAPVSPAPLALFSPLFPAKSVATRDGKQSSLPLTSSVWQAADDVSEANPRLSCLSK